jgi:hypothetical protein
MVSNRVKIPFLFLILLACSQCGPLERDNPLDPAAPDQVGPSVEGETTEMEPAAALTLTLPLPKPLIIVIHRIVATLTGPDFQPIIKELTVSPIGPAFGTIGTIQPGQSRSLTLEGFDLEGNLLFTGSQDNITIVAGDTARVEILLQLTQPLPPDDGGTTEEPDDGGTTEEPDDGGTTGEPDDGGTTEEPDDGGTTEEPDDGGTTEEPDDGGTTEEPDDGGTTEEPDDGGTTEEPDDGGTTEEPDDGTDAGDDTTGDGGDGGDTIEPADETAG